MTEREKILQEIETFLRRTGMGPTQFGIESLGRRSLLNQLRDRGGLNMESAAKIRAFMREHRKNRRPPAKRAESRAM